MPHVKCVPERHDIMRSDVSTWESIFPVVRHSEETETGFRFHPRMSSNLNGTT